MGTEMAGTNKPWRPRLTRREKRVGWCFFALYLFVLPFLVEGAVGYLERRLDLTFTAAQSRAVYYTIILLLLIAVFWDFLRNALTILRENFRPSFFIFGAGLLVGLGLTCLAGAIPLPVENPARTLYREEYFLAGGATFAVVVLLRPAVEEILFRGLVFGALCKKSRVLAYALSAGLFALSTVWLYVLYGADPDYQASPAFLLLMIQYLPLGLVECWVYDVSGSVYTPMALRMALQAAFLIFALMV